VAGLLLASRVAAFLVWARRPQERLRAAGLFYFLGAMACLGLAVGVGRAGYGPGAAFEPRYLTMASPALCGAYFVWVICPPPALACLFQAGLFTLTLCLGSQNVTLAIGAGSWHREHMKAVEQDLQAGKPAALLAARHGDFLVPSFGSREIIRDVITGGLQALRRVGARPFQRMADDPALKAVPFPVAPAALGQMTWDSGAGRGTGPNPWVTFALKEPQLVYAIRLRYALSYEGGPAPRTAWFRAFWKRADQNDFPPNQVYSDWVLEPTPGYRSVTFWVGEPIDQFRIQPDTRPCVLRIASIELLVPAAGGQSTTGS
jgi:hypothetical protein